MTIRKKISALNKLIQGNGKFNFKRWVKGVFKKQPKVIIPTPKPKKQSITSKIRNKINKSKINVEDIELLMGADARQLKKQYSVTGSQAKLLEQMVDDYKRGKISVPGLSRKVKTKAKPLDKARLNKMLKQYDQGSRERNIEEAKKNAAMMKKKYNMSQSEAADLEKVLMELSKGKGSHVELVRNLLDPKKLTKERIDKFITKYKEAQKKKRGLSYLITQSNLSFVASKRKVEKILKDVQGIKGLSGMIRQYQ